MRAQEAAEVMKITADDLKQLQIIERIVPEYGSADASTVADISGFMKERITEFLEKFDGIEGEEIARMRYDRYRKF